MAMRTTAITSAVHFLILYVLHIDSVCFFSSIRVYYNKVLEKHKMFFLYSLIKLITGGI